MAVSFCKYIGYLDIKHDEKCSLWRTACSGVYVPNSRRTMMSKFRFVLMAVLALTTLILGGTAYADTITDGDLTFTATVTPTLVTLTIQCTSNVSTCENWFVGDVTLKGFTFTTLGTATAPTGFLDMVQNGGQNNDAVGAGGGCNGTQKGMAVCWDALLPPLGTKLGTGV